MASSKLVPQAHEHDHANADSQQKFEKSTFLTLEAFVTELARHLTVDLDYPHAAVSAHKPGVFGMADGPGVQIVRTKQYFETAARR